MKPNFIYISEINKPECWEVGEYYFVFKNGSSKAGEDFILEYLKNKEMLDKILNQTIPEATGDYCKGYRDALDQIKREINAK